MSDARCPCGGFSTATCCGPILAGANPAVTAEALMRSRYTAFALGLVDHLVATWDPATRPVELTVPAAQTWHGLRILDTARGGALDADGEVEFIATYRIGGEEAQLHERSRFRRDAGRWLYVDGDQF